MVDEGRSERSPFFYPSLSRRSEQRELIDDPIESFAELEASMRDIEFVNAWLGGTAPVARELDRIGAATVLDVGTGTADIPHALVRRAERRRAQLEITCLDRSEQMLSLAQKRTRAHPRLHFVLADGERLPFEDRSFDVAMCNLALHHFDPVAAVGMLRELRRVSRREPLVCDLRRSFAALGGAFLFSRLLSTNRLTHHDATLSVRRAYTPAEALELAIAAGWTAPRVRSHPFFRMTLCDG